MIITECSTLLLAKVSCPVNIRQPVQYRFPCRKSRYCRRQVQELIDKKLVTTGCERPLGLVERAAGSWDLRCTFVAPAKKRQNESEEFGIQDRLGMHHL
jgi:hypothetical protein